MFEFHKAPYFDDYLRPGDDGRTPKEKNFLKVLYRPGFAVQARELNSMQSILLNQIRLLTKLNFTDRTHVSGNRTDSLVVLPSGYVEIEWTLPKWVIDPLNDSPAVIANKKENVLRFLSQYSAGNIIAVDSSPVAEMPEVYDVHVIDDNIYGIYLKDANATEFSVTDELTITEDYIVGEFVEIAREAIFAEIKKIHKSIRYTIDSENESVYTVDGYLIETTKAAELLFDVEASVFDYVFYLNPTIQEISSISDKSLKDNASGTINWNADGANRFAIVLEIGYADNNESPINIPEGAITIVASIDESSTSDTITFTVASSS
jgi:hypothetical protein